MKKFLLLILMLFPLNALAAGDFRSDEGGSNLESTALPECSESICTLSSHAGKICVNTGASTGNQIFACEGVTGWVLQGDDGGAGGGITAITSDSGVTSGTTVSILGGATGVDITETSADVLTIAFDSTEVTGNITWGSSSAATYAWTWNVNTGTDPVLTFGNNTLGFGDISLTAASSLTFTDGDLAEKQSPKVVKLNSPNGSSNTGGVQEALDACNASPNDTCEIQLGPGTYDITKACTDWVRSNAGTPADGLATTGGGAILIDGDKNIKFVGAGMNATIINWDADFSDSACGISVGDTDARAIASVFRIESYSGQLTRWLTFQDMQVIAKNTNLSETAANLVGVAGFDIWENGFDVRDITWDRVHIHALQDDIVGNSDAAAAFAIKTACWSATICSPNAHQLYFTNGRIHTSDYGLFITQASDFKITNSWLGNIDEVGYGCGIDLVYKRDGTFSSSSNYYELRVDTQTIADCDSSTTAQSMRWVRLDASPASRTHAGKWAKFNGDTFFVEDENVAAEVLEGIYLIGYNGLAFTNNTLICSKDLIDSATAANGDAALDDCAMSVVMLADRNGSPGCSDTTPCNTGNLFANNIFWNFRDTGNNDSQNCPFVIQEPQEGGTSDAERGHNGWNLFVNNIMHNVNTSGVTDATQDGFCGETFGGNDISESVNNNFILNNYVFGKNTLCVVGQGTTSGSSNGETCELKYSLASSTSTGEISASETMFVLPSAAVCATTDCDEAGEAGRICYDTNATTGTRILACEGVSGWVTQGGGGGAETNTLTTILTGIADDQIVVGSAANDSEYKTLTDCNGAGEATTYDTATNEWGCITGLGAGGTVDGLAADSGGTTTGATVTVAGGSNGIDTARSTDTVTFNLDYTEISTATFGTGSAWTWGFNSGTTDPAIDFGDGFIRLDTTPVRIGDAGTINSATGDGDLYIEDALEVDGAATILSATIPTIDIDTLNGLDTVDATGEDTIEALIFDADAQNISGVWEVQDDVDLVFGNDANWAIQYDEGVDDQLLFITAGTAAIATTDPMFEILVGTTPTANQEVFGVGKGTQSTNTALFTVDEDGDTIITGDLTVNGTGTSDFDGAVTAPSFAADPSATPTIGSNDSDFDGAGNETAIVTNCPTDGDCDLAFQAKTAGTLTEVFRIDTADAGTQSVIFAATIDIAALGLTYSTGALSSTDLEVLDDGSIVTGEITDATLAQVDVDDTQTLAGANGPASSVWFGTTGFIFEGANDNTVETLLIAADPTSSDKTITLPDLTGTVALDTTTNKTCQNWTKLTPVDADDHFMFKAVRSGITITDIDCIIIGGTSIAMDVQECGADGTSCSTVDAAVTCDTDGAADDGSFSNGPIDQNDWVKLVYAAPSGSVTSVSVNVCWTEALVQ